MLFVSLYMKGGFTFLSRRRLYESNGELRKSGHLVGEPNDKEWFINRLVNESNGQEDFVNRLIHKLNGEENF